MSAWLAPQQYINSIATARSFRHWVRLRVNLSAATLKCLAAALSTVLNPSVQNVLPPAVAASVCRNGSDGSEPLDCIRILLHKIDEQRGLCIRFGAALLPIFQRADIGAQINRK